MFDDIIRKPSLLPFLLSQWRPSPEVSRDDPQPLQADILPVKQPEQERISFLIGPIKVLRFS